MDEQTDIWESEYYAVPKKYMSLVGIWPYDDMRKRYLRFFPSFIFSFGIIVPQISPLLIGPIDIDVIFECVPSIFITTVFSYKILRLMINDKKVMTCIKTIENDWRSLESDVERTILQQRVRYGQRLTVFYKTLMLLTLFFYSIKPVLLTLLEGENSTNKTKSRIEGQAKLPYLVDYGRFNKHFYIIMLHSYAAVFFHIFITIAVDTLYQTLIQHSCGMFMIIGRILEDIGKDNDINYQLNPAKSKDADYNKALNCLRRHLDVIKFAELIESTYTDILLVSVNLNMIAGSLLGIQVIMNLSNTGDIAAPLSVYIAQLNHLFLQFWQAQFLLDYSVLPYKSICKGNWCHTSRRCQKILLLIMIRAAIPCQITAGKILTLSIESFSNVMKTSMSYFTMLRSFQ